MTPKHFANYSRSNANVLLPVPLTPVTTTNRLRGIVSDTFLRLCSCFSNQAITYHQRLACGWRSLFQ